MKKIAAILCFLFLCFLNLSGQINVHYPDIDDWVNKNFAGEGIIIGNITHKGNPDAMASFTSTPNVLKITKGLLVSTGEAISAIGPNDRYNVSKDFGTILEHDKDLKALEKGDLYDVSLIEFDFVPFHNSIKFNYQFASDEYPEYVSSSFNDIFAFFISDSKNTKNIAVVPGKNIPVSVNTINDQHHPELFIDNNVFLNDISKKNVKIKDRSEVEISKKLWRSLKNVFSNPKNNSPNEYEPNEDLLKNVDENLYHFLQYDGITQKLTAQAYVEPYKKYHLKIIIADVADNVYDSAVFLETHSLTAAKDSKQQGFNDYADYSKIIDCKRILNGELLENLLPKELELISTNIYFDFDKTEISPTEMKKIDALVETYEKIKKNYRIEIVGNTDSIGSYAYNLNLSKARSLSVIKVLQNAIPGFEFDELAHKSYTQPRHKNNTESGRKLNRRVTVNFVRIKK
ncbi:MAG: OmpA family protein [Sphingobacteriales bacterium]|nr:MAG: OmpA family protein [Sphingobacteriales bacterium]TAF78197.1 MAG: OmpA family protein [Sphingobacteriales bacterium]